MKGIVLASIMAGPSHEEICRRSNRKSRLSAFMISEHSFGELFVGPDHTREIMIEIVMCGIHRPVDDGNTVSFIGRYRHMMGDFEQWDLYYTVGMYDTSTGKGNCLFIPRETAYRDLVVKSLFFAVAPEEVSAVTEISETANFTD